MARYINADKLIAWCNQTFQAQSTVAGKAYVNALLTAVDSCPTADVAPIADTVRKMQERLIAEFRKDDRMNYYIRKVLDQIAKEMVEDNK